MWSINSSHLRHNIKLKTKNTKHNKYVIINAWANELSRVCIACDTWSKHIDFDVHLKPIKWHMEEFYMLDWFNHSTHTIKCATPLTQRHLKSPQAIKSYVYHARAHARAIPSDTNQSNILRIIMSRYYSAVHPYRTDYRVQTYSCLHK